MNIKRLIIFGIVGLLPLVELHANEIEKGSSMTKRPRLRVVSGTERKMPIKLFSAHGMIEAEVTAIRLDIELPNGKKKTSEMIIGRENKTNLTWWRLAPGPKYSREPLMDYLKNNAIYRTPEEIVVFSILGGKSLLIERFNSNHKTIQEAANSVLPKLSDELDTVGYPHGSGKIVVKLWPILGNDFFFLKFHSTPSGTVVSEVTKRGSNWEIFLQGPNKDTAQISLNGQFEIISGTINGKTVPRKSAK